MTSRTKTSLVLAVALAGIALVCLFPARSLTQTQADEKDATTLNHANFTELLERHVNENGWVDYEGLSRDRAMLNTYLQQLASAQPASFPTDHDRLAFWINSYNANILASVLDWVYGKANGVRDVPGFFNRERHTVAGEQLTLDQIEQRARDFHDPRVHFTLVCASTSCPKLQRFAYTGQELGTQLQQAMREFLADPMKGVRMDPGHNRIYLSSIFKWYAGDFTGKPSATGQLFARAKAYISGSNVLEYIKQHSSGDVTHYIEEKHPTVEYFDYDWSLNSQNNHPTMKGRSGE